MYIPTLRFVSDPGHGWLRVPRRLINELGIADKISQYSYVSDTGEDVFLEEDDDAPRFLFAMKDSGREYKIIEAEPSNNDSFVRRLRRFTP